VIRDIWTVAWREWKELFSRDGGLSGKLGLLIFAAFVGVFLPWQLGRAWIEAPWVTFFWAWMPLFLVTAVTADAFAGERERHTLETLLASRLPDSAILLGKVLATVLYVWGLTLVCMPLGLVTINLTHADGGLLLYSAKTLVSLAGLSLLATLLGSSTGVLVSLRASSVRVAQQNLSMISMVLAFVPVLIFQALPVPWQANVLTYLMGASISEVVVILATFLAALDITLLLIAMARFRRDRLVLD
jgi:ABC-2 type transport system permease protein